MEEGESVPVDEEAKDDHCQDEEDGAAPVPGKPAPKNKKKMAEDNAPPRPKKKKEDKDPPTKSKRTRRNPK